jgi:hypothetical protein
VANAELCHEKDFWIEEINKSEGLVVFGMNANMGNCLNLANYSDLEKSLSTISHVLSNNLSSAKVINIDLFSNDKKKYNIRTTNILKALVNNKTIKRVILNRVPASSDILLAKIIEQNSTIEDIHLEGAKLSEEGVVLISDALKKNKSLKYLDFSQSKILSSDNYNYL